MRAILAALMLCVLALPANAAHRHHHHRHSVIVQHKRPSFLVTVQTAAAIPITVASSLALSFESLIADFVAHGYQPKHIHCFARSGHIHQSRHYVGAACDFDQTGWGKTAPFMRTPLAHALIVENGLRDGGDFRHPDWGHVDDGGTLRARHIRAKGHHRRRVRYDPQPTPDLADCWLACWWKPASERSHRFVLPRRPDDGFGGAVQSPRHDGGDVERAVQHAGQGVPQRDLRRRAHQRPWPQ